jgi:hypothetical protein
MPTLADIQTIASNSVLPAQHPLPATMAEVFVGQFPSVWCRYDWTNAQIVALGAVTAGDIKVCTIPPRTLVKNCLVFINTAETSANALTVAVGRVAAGYIDYIAASDAKAAAGTIYGKLAAERGTANVGGEVPSLASNTDVFAHFIKTTTNLNTCTLSSGSVFLELVILP